MYRIEEHARGQFTFVHGYFIYGNGFLDGFFSVCARRSFHSFHLASFV